MDERARKDTTEERNKELEDVSKESLKTKKQKEQRQKKEYSRDNYKKA